VTDVAAAETMITISVKQNAETATFYESSTSVFTMAIEIRLELAQRS
jgi:hypothetical protein